VQNGPIADSESPLVSVSRPPAGAADGLLVLMHGRGTSEQDLAGLFDLLDSERRLHLAAPRGPLQIPGAPGNHWYVVERVGYPDPDTFARSYGLLGEWLERLAQETGIGPDRTVLGGFSQGTVMSYALGLGADRPVPAGILALSGFIPQVGGWTAGLEERREMPVLISHGERDPVIPVSFAREAREQLEPGGLDVTYRESPIGHWIDGPTVDAARAWLETALPRQPI
jgi:phospholipase/carboxylesterase